jgi:hypothetical protein
VQEKIPTVSNVMGAAFTGKKSLKLLLALKSKGLAERVFCHLLAPHQNVIFLATAAKMGLVFEKQGVFQAVLFTMAMTTELKGINNE